MGPSGQEVKPRSHRRAHPLIRMRLKMIYRMALSLTALLAAAACSGTDASNPTGPIASPSSSASSSSESSSRSGALHVTKECSEYHGLAGEHCTITSSSLKQIEVGS